MERRRLDERVARRRTLVARETRHADPEVVARDLLADPPCADRGHRVRRHRGQALEDAGDVLARAEPIAAVVGRVPAVVEHRPVDAGRTQAEEPVAVLEVGLDAVGGIERPRVVERAPRHERALEVDGIALEEVDDGERTAGAPAEVAGRHEVRPRGVVDLHPPPVAEDGVERRVLAQEGSRPGEAVRHRHVVGVVEGDPLAGRAREAEVPRARETAVSALDDGHAAGVCAEHPRRVVGRAVVDDDDLEVLLGLREDAVEAFGEPAAAVVGRDDDRDGRHTTRRRE